MTKFGYRDCEDDSENNGAGFVEIFEIFLTQDAIVFRMEPFDRVFMSVCGILWSNQPCAAR